MKEILDALQIDVNDPCFRLASELVHDHSELIDNLIHVRKMRGLTIEDVAESLGVTVDAIRKLEVERDPRLSSLRRYALAVGVRVQSKLTVVDFD